MTKLALMTTALGSIMACIYMLMVIIPAPMRVWFKKFPRSRWSGAVLAAIDLICVEWILHNAALGRFEHLRLLLYLLGPIVFLLVVKFMNELLAPRALGGLLLLIPAPILAEARLHDTAFRYVIIVIAYILIIKGTILMLSPYKFRQWGNLLAKNEGSCRLWGVIGLGFAIFILYLGIAVY
ncbi:hypothetical protein ACFLS1_09600 [Verrucomicrobiota bacterium]